MFDDFKKYLQERIALSDDDSDFIARHSQPKKLRRKQYLLQAGDVWKYDAFVCRGLLKLYFADEKGQEHILRFAPENNWTGDRESMETGLPSKYNIDAIEETEVILILKEDFEMLRKTISVFNDFVSDTLKKNLIAHQERIYVNITNTAEEKYRNFIKQFPQIANRVPLHMIASYLGISAETLSRTRSQKGKK